MALALPMQAAIGHGVAIVPAPSGASAPRLSNDCDRMAGDPLDPLGPGAGAGHDFVDPAKAIAACTKELAKAPTSPRVQYQLSRAYAAAEDSARALTFLRKASDQAYPAAQALLAEFYLEGEELPQDDREAARLFRAAAERGVGSAQVHLAGMYIDGRGVEQSDVTGLALLHRSADGGYAEAQALLGQLYLDGGLSFVNDELVARNPARATHYLKLAAAQGHEEAAELLATLDAPATPR
ncbi:tetratricopeptide repeat protein [Panacagrimonas perspica]|uniref:tetratricopeptide repeat protein n=1 Tax=Panacagrimonas perspica TaxID=381431 RepID=UPI0013C30C32|nr:tetratricopeptide repeat protein [Panacagrimonas perspica]